MNVTLVHLNDGHGGPLCLVTMPGDELMSPEEAHSSGVVDDSTRRLCITCAWRDLGRMVSEVTAHETEVSP